MHCTKNSPDFKCQGQRSKVKVTGEKTEKVRHFFGGGPRGRGYAGGKISACCLFATACSYSIVHVNIRQAFPISLDLFVNT